MTPSDLTANAAHHHRAILHELHMASMQCSPDATIALIELLNEQMSELCWDCHHGAAPKPRILALKTEAERPVNGFTHPRKIKFVEDCATQELVPVNA